MKIEHIAFNVSDPVAMADWYGKHLGLTILRQVPGPALTHFLGDDHGATVLEIYCNPADQVPDYASMDPLLFHLAFLSTCPDTDRERLINAGASFVEEIKREDGTHLVMLRDPWGISLQLCKRAEPLVAGA